MKKLIKIFCAFGLLVFCLSLSPVMAQERVFDENVVTPWTDSFANPDGNPEDSSLLDDEDESQQSSKKLGRWERFISILVRILEGEGISDKTIDEDNAESESLEAVATWFDVKRWDDGTLPQLTALIKSMSRDQAIAFNSALNTALNSGFKIGYEANITLLEKLVEDDLDIKEIKMLARALQKNA